jgi:hypothetical protein
VGVIWHFIVGAPEALGDGASTSPSGEGEALDEVVRPELPPEQHAGPVRPKGAAVRGRAHPPETGTGTAAPSPRRCRFREILSRRLLGSQKPQAPRCM